MGRFVERRKEVVLLIWLEFYEDINKERDMKFKRKYRLIFCFLKNWMYDCCWRVIIYLKLEILRVNEYCFMKLLRGFLKFKDEVLVKK